MNAPSITFDSNVWENIVDESKRTGIYEYEKLYELIKSQSVIPFFFEGIATMESISKKDRKDYMGNYKATISVQVDNEEPYITQGSNHPGLTDYLKTNILQALALGFKFIKFPRIGILSLDIDAAYFAKDEIYPLEERLSRSFECSGFIESLGSGKSRLHSRLNGADNKGIVNQTSNDASLSANQYGKDFGEWVDGDALAAHYGYGFDFFCTNDQAKGAGTASIFSQNNLIQLTNKFEIKVVSPVNLLDLLYRKRGQIFIIDKLKKEKF